MPREPLQRGDTMDDLERLALRPAEAARILGISARTLWSWTRRGVVPYVHVGRIVRYPRAALEAWLAEQAARHSAPESEAEGSADE